MNLREVSSERASERGVCSHIWGNEVFISILSDEKKGVEEVRQGCGSAREGRALVQPATFPGVETVEEMQYSTRRHQAG